MTRRLGAMLLALAALPASALPAGAERLITSLSNQQVMVTSSFTGADLVLFGTVEADAGAVPRQGNYDLVVTVIGPRHNVLARRKEREVGIWVNVESREFIGVPSFLAVLSNRPVADIADPDIRRRLQVGTDFTLLPQRIGNDIADTVATDPMRRAFVRLKGEHRLYQENPEAVTFIAPAVFRAAIPLPAAVPIGTYSVDVKLFVAGAMVGRATSALDVMKAGFEEVVAEAAHEYGLLYGIATAIMALFTGWFASLVFKRD